jgi:hypothetical protein
MVRFTILLIALAVLPATPAWAVEERWAAPTGDPAATACTPDTPCSLQAALSGAADGAEIVLLPGDYTVDAPLVVDRDVDVHGYEGSERPTIESSVLQAEPVLTVSAPGATVTHLEVVADAAGQVALALEAGRADRVVAHAESGHGATVRGTAALTNSLATTAGASAAAVRIEDGPAAGAIAVRNVTAYGGATGIRCATATGSTALVDTLARGDGYDLDGQGSNCTRERTNSRPGKTRGVSGANTDDQNPKLDAGFRPLAGSSTIDRGLASGAVGLLDLAGEPRTIGSAPDIGAYEYASAGAPGDDTGKGDNGNGNGGSNGNGNAGNTGNGATGNGETKPRNPNAATPADPNGAGRPATPAGPGPGAGTEADTQPVELPPAAPPELGRTVLLDTSGGGTVLVRIPGTDRFIELTDASSLPVGTVVDTRKGSVTLSSALGGGRRQTGTFRGGMFEVRQRSNGMTDIKLTGGSFAGCPAPRRKGRATARAAAGKRSPARRKSRRSTIRRLWAKDKGGKFRTHGSNSVATVRGTSWLTADRCDGTYTKVTEGVVDVRDKRTGRTRRLRKGRSILVGR